MPSEEAETRNGGWDESIWQQIREYLEQERRRIASEITNYPSPIAGCDAQFTALLEQRDGIVEALRRCDAYERLGAAGGDARAQVDEFFRQSAQVPGSLAQRLRSAMSEDTGPLGDATARQA